MTRPLQVILALLCAVLLNTGHAATRLDSLTVGYSTFSGAYGPLWIAVEDHLGAKHGVVKVGLDMLSLQYPQAKQIDASLIVDPSIVRKIEESGFIRALAKK